MECDTAVVKHNK